MDRHNEIIIKRMYCVKFFSRKNLAAMGATERDHRGHITSIDGNNPYKANIGLKFWARVSRIAAKLKSKRKLAKWIEFYTAVCGKKNKLYRAVSFKKEIFKLDMPFRRVIKDPFALVIKGFNYAPLGLVRSTKLKTLSPYRGLRQPPKSFYILFDGLTEQTDLLRLESVVQPITFVWIFRFPIDWARPS